MTRQLSDNDRLRVRVLFHDARFTKKAICATTGFSMHQVKNAIRNPVVKPRSGRPPALSAEDEAALLAFVRAHPSTVPLTYAALADQCFNGKHGVHAIRSTLRRHGCVPRALRLRGKKTAAGEAAAAAAGKAAAAAARAAAAAAAAAKTAATAAAAAEAAEATTTTATMTTDAPGPEELGSDADMSDSDESAMDTEELDVSALRAPEPAVSATSLDGTPGVAPLAATDPGTAAPPTAEPHTTALETAPVPGQS